MGRWRRQPGWVALLAVLVYALAPLLAAARPHVPISPAQCSTQPEAHSCACRPDPHGAGECCCKPAASEGNCRLSALPCQTDTTDAAAPLWTFSNPLPEPEPSLRARFTSGAMIAAPAQASATLRGSGTPLTPPPQQSNCA